jgi:hypothetical protein
VFLSLGRLPTHLRTANGISIVEALIQMEPYKAAESAVVYLVDVC